jgi:hypothetical protein
MAKKNFAFDFCVYNIYQYIYIFFLLVFVFTGVFNLQSIGYFLSNITIVVNLYGTVHGKKKKKLLVLCLQHIPIFFFCVFNGVFNLYGNGYLFIYFSYITIVVDLYGTAHGKNNQLYNYFCFWFLCLQYIPVFIYFFAFGFCVY